MAGPSTERAFYIDEDMMAEMRTLFGTAQNTYRWLRLERIGVPLYSFQRMTRKEPARQTEIVDVETAWEEFKKEHNLTDAHFEGLPNLEEIRNTNRLLRQGSRRGANMRNGAAYVQEEFEEPEGDYFDFDV